MSNDLYFADSLAFLGPQGERPIFNPWKRPWLRLAHVTSVPPTRKPIDMYDFDTAFAAHCTFRKNALSNALVHTVRTRSDLDKAGIGLLFGMQHAPDGLTLERVRQLSDAGVRVMGLAYDEASEYGSGYKVGGGLTGRGRELLRWMAACSVIPDLSHLNERTAIETLEFIRDERLPLKPMASHSGCYCVYPHARNLSDNAIRKIIALKGYVGIPTITFLIGKGEEGADHLGTMMKHFAWINYLRGSENLGVGSDGVHQDMTMDEARVHFDRMTALLKGHLPDGLSFPDRPPELIMGGSRMFEIIKERMVWGKFPPGLIRNLLGENFRVFLHRSLPRA